jgi:hypothetical protein
MEHVNLRRGASPDPFPDGGESPLEVFQVQVVVLCCILDGGQDFLVEGNCRNLIGGYFDGENLPAEPFRLVT